MAALDALKRAPRWTWYIAGGVGLGAVAIRVYNGRDADDADVSAGDGSTVGDSTPGTVYPGTTGSSPPGVIVPPIITGGDGGSASDLGAAFAGLIGGTITDLTGLVGMTIDAQGAATQTWIGAMSDNTNTWISAWQADRGEFLKAIAEAGSRPLPVAQNPTPVVVNVAPPPAAPVAAPPAPTKPKPPNPAYPFFQEVGPRAGQWYKVVLKGGEKFRYYASGDKIKVND